MVEELEKAQKALRDMDYDSMSEGDDEEPLSKGRSLDKDDGKMQLPSPEVSAESASKLEDFLSDNNKNLLIDTSSYPPVQPTRKDPWIEGPTTVLPESSNALFDEEDASTGVTSVELSTQESIYPGTAGYLEMEEEPPRKDPFLESIRTDSGLVLTHRKTALSEKPRSQHSYTHTKTAFRHTQQDYFEVEKGGYHGWNKENPNFKHRMEGISYFGGGGGNHSMLMVQARRWLSYVKIWVVLFSLLALSMTGIFVHSLGRGEPPETVVSKLEGSSDGGKDTASVLDTGETVVFAVDIVPEEIILLPYPGIAKESALLMQQQQPPSRRLGATNGILSHNSESSENSLSQTTPHSLLVDLKQEFEDWIHHHGRKYRSEEEKEHRFSIWSKNHQRTAEKNVRHGPCKLTKQHVFGSNHFKDLAPEEFRDKFLTGYKGAYADVLEEKHQALSAEERKLRKNSGIGMVLNPKTHPVQIHDSVKEKQRHLQQMMTSSSYRPQVMGNAALNCEWYDLSCVLRYIWTSTGIQFGSFIGTMEPKFDADAFPNAVDWRDSGAVTSVRTQGDCGACWAVTAVETIESAYFLATGKLYTLSESEIIVCDDSCQMCSGGWPQNAFEWVMDHGGLPLSSTFPYDSYTLLELTEGLEGTSNYYDESTLESYRSEVCPAGEGNSHSGSNDQGNYWAEEVQNDNYADNSSQGRYGNIRGYGYATDRCLCYTDGSGCECDDQDEDTAVGNIATYGPAVVCLEASTWQDYAGGIMTAEIGCGQEFLDMNHCVQVVGYAFTDGEEGCEGEDCSGSKSRSGDSKQREGYWIVRNQWGESWGMNGYAYLSMGENTCGILNDMTIAYA